MGREWFMKNKDKPKFQPNTWGITFEEYEYSVIVTNKTKDEVVEIVKKIKEKKTKRNGSRKWVN